MIKDPVTMIESVGEIVSVLMDLLSFINLRRRRGEDGKKED